MTSFILSGMVMRESKKRTFCAHSILKKALNIPMIVPPGHMQFLSLDISGGDVLPVNQAISSQTCVKFMFICWKMSVIGFEQHLPNTNDVCFLECYLVKAVLGGK